MKNKEQIIQHKTDKNFNVSTSTVISKQPLHWHEFYEVELYTEGKGAHYINGTQVLSDGGFITLLTPKDFHLIDADIGSKFYIKKFVFYEDYVSEELIKLINDYSPCAINLSAEQTEHFLGCINRLQELKNAHRSVMTDVEMRILAEKVCIEILQLSQSEIAYKITNSQRMGNTFHEIINYMEKHFAEKITLADVAKELHISPNYLSRYFSELFGISFSRYLKTMRISRATHLLKHSQLSVSEIAFASGFNTLSFFNSSFKEMYGIVPSEYRQNYLKGKQEKTEAANDK